MYGFAPLRTHTPYAVYLSDLDLVWSATPTRAEVEAQARGLGIVDFDDAKLAFFVAELVSIFALVPSPLVFHKVSEVEFTVEARIGGSIRWKFSLALADSSATACFFRNQTVAAFANHSFLAYKVSQLENLIKARDKYTMYLEENYKTVNGSELMDKYKRQHGDDARLLASYDRDSTNRRIRKLYGKLLAKRRQKSESLVWDNVKVSLRDATTWEANSDSPFVDADLDEKVSDMPKPSFGLKNIPKLEHQSQSESQSQSQSQSQPHFPSLSQLNTPHWPSSSPPPSQLSSPAKRGRSDSSVSPKRKRVGVIGRR